MARITFDVLLLQAHLGHGQRINVCDIAKQVFGGNGDAVSHARATRAARALVSAKQAKAVYEGKNIVSIASDVSNGTQLGALMNLAIRRAIKTRAEVVEQD